VTHTAVIGCGNLARSDDGVGPYVVRALAQRGVSRDGVRLLDAGTDGLSVMHAAKGCRRLILIDAVRSGSPPGAVFEVPASELHDRAPPPPMTLHDFRWEHALFAGKRMYGAAFPADVTVLLVEAESTAFGLELSPAVAAGADKVAARVESLLR